MDNMHKQQRIGTAPAPQVPSVDYVVGNRDSQTWLHVFECGSLSWQCSQC